MFRKLIISATFCTTPFVANAALLLDYRGLSSDSFGGVGSSGFGGGLPGSGWEQSPPPEEVKVIGERPACEGRENCIPADSFSASMWRHEYETAEATRLMIQEMKNREERKEAFKKECEESAESQFQKCEKGAFDGALDRLDSDCEQYKTALTVTFNSDRIPIGFETSQANLEFCMKRIDLLEKSDLMQCEIDYSDNHKKCETAGESQY